MAENNEQRPQGQRSPERKGGYNRNRNHQNRNRNFNKPLQAQQENKSGNQTDVSKDNRVNQQNSNKGIHKNFNKSKNHNNRFEGKKIHHVETVEDIKSDMARIEKEIELEIEEISAMTLG